MVSTHLLLLLLYVCIRTDRQRASRISKERLKVFQKLHVPSTVGVRLEGLGSEPGVLLVKDWFEYLCLPHGVAQGLLNQS